MTPDALVCTDDSFSPDEAPPPVARQQSSFDIVVDEARAVPSDKVIDFHADDDLAFRNVSRTIKAIEPLQPLMEKVPGIAPNLTGRLYTLALALLFAGRRIALATGKAQAAQVDMLRLRELRMAFLHAFQSVAILGHAPMEPLTKILSGRGNLDAAQDCIDLVAYQREHADALSGKTPITAEHLDEAESLAHEVRDQLALVGNLLATPAQDVALASDDRKRIWTLLVEAHAQAVVVGTVGFGPKKVNELVPSLQSRQGLPKKPAARKQPPQQGAAS